LPNVPVGPLILSPDGTRLAYLSSNERKLFVRRLDQDKAVELAGAQNSTLPFFSPYGKWIGYFDGGAGWKAGGSLESLTPLMFDYFSACSAHPFSSIREYSPEAKISNSNPSCSGAAKVVCPRWVWNIWSA